MWRRGPWKGGLQCLHGYIHVRGLQLTVLWSFAASRRLSAHCFPAYSTASLFCVRLTASFQPFPYFHTQCTILQLKIPPFSLLVKVDFLHLFWTQLIVLCSVLCSVECSIIVSRCHLAAQRITYSSHWKSAATCVPLSSPNCCASRLICCQSNCEIYLVGWDLSWNTVHPISYPSVCFSAVGPALECLVYNVCAIWQLLIKRQYANPLSGLWIRPHFEDRREDKIQLMLQPQFSVWFLK